MLYKCLTLYWALSYTLEKYWDMLLREKYQSLWLSGRLPGQLVSFRTCGVFLSACFLAEWIAYKKFALQYPHPLVVLWRGRWPGSPSIGCRTSRVVSMKYWRMYIIVKQRLLAITKHRFCFNLWTKCIHNKKGKTEPAINLKVSMSSKFLALKLCFQSDGLVNLYACPMPTKHDMQ